MNRTQAVQRVEELEVYQSALDLQQKIFISSKSYPREEAFALTDQIRRSARAIGANICEAWAKRRYPAHFVSKLTDTDAEKEETLHWLKTAALCGYADLKTTEDLTNQARSVGKMLGVMIRTAANWAPPETR